MLDLYRIVSLFQNAKGICSRVRCNRKVYSNSKQAHYTLSLQNTKQGDNSMKYKDWLNIWLNNYIKPSAKARTIESYERIIQKQLADTLGNTEITELTTMGIQLFVTELLTNGNGKTQKGLAASSVNTIITVIQSSLKTAVILGYTNKNVAEGVKRPKIKGKEVTCFTLQEQKKIEQAVLQDKRSKMFGVVLCLYTGLRIGELLALTWNDIDLNKGLLTINKTCHDGSKTNNYKRITDEPKTQSSKRTIPIPRQLLPQLKQLKRATKSEHIISAGNQPPTIRSYQRSFALLLNKTGVEHKSFHSLRHTFATRALECGMDVKTLSEILGHKNATVTLNRYAHSLLEHKQDMMNKLGKLFEREK